ncbi:MAG: hypothetical protein KJ818_04210, partial [Candidatus Omnitrophica bacterium]|nr:hypothetical protein [Candidatus Omnitrophota bacterium]
LTTYVRSFPACRQAGIRSISCGLNKKGAFLPSLVTPKHIGLFGVPFLGKDANAFVLSHFDVFTTPLQVKIPATW